MAGTTAGTPVGASGTAWLGRRKAPELVASTSMTVDAGGGGRWRVRIQASSSSSGNLRSLPPEASLVKSERAEGVRWENVAGWRQHGWRSKTWRQHAPLWTDAEYEVGDPLGSVKVANHSVLGAATLIVGTTVGTGSLALPARTVALGFAPTSATMVVVWAYLFAQAVLLSEVNCAIREREDAENRAQGLPPLDPGRVVSLPSMAERTLGPSGALFTAAAYLALDYTIITAALSKGGEMVEVLGLAPRGDPTLAVVVFGALLSAVVGTQTCAGTERFVRPLVICSMATFGYLLYTGVVSGLDWPTLAGVHDTGALPGALPAIVIALVYHDMIPVVCSLLDGDQRRIRAALLLGSLVPLGLFVGWDGIALSATGRAGLSGTDVDPLRALLAGAALDGGDGGASLSLGLALFSLCAVATCFLSTALSVTEFGDYEINKGIQRGTFALPASVSPRWLSLAAAVVPAAAVAVTYPDAFLHATDIAGAYGMTVLYGIIPPFMAWELRRNGGCLPDDASCDDVYLDELRVRSEENTLQRGMDVAAAMAPPGAPVLVGLGMAAAIFAVNRGLTDAAGMLALRSG